MKFFRSKTGKTFCSLYLGLYFLSGVYAVCFLLFRPPTPEFNPPSLVALPWTFVIVPLAHSWGMTDWYERHVGSPILYGTVMTLIFLPGALLNAVIVYLFGKFIDWSRRRSAAV
jgi:hypothetical protein